jgi:hypothetical protein
LLRVLGFEKGALHTLLSGGICFDVWFLGAFFASHPPAGFNALRAHQWVPMRSALASRERGLLRALGFEKGALHTLLSGGICFDVWFLDAFFASQKTGLSAIIKTQSVFIPLLSLVYSAAGLDYSCARGLPFLNVPPLGLPSCPGSQNPSVSGYSFFFNNKFLRASSRAALSRNNDNPVVKDHRHSRWFNQL